MTSTRPSYPGARWWKFDFHTHTPASSDTNAWAAAIGTPEEVTPESWLLKFMAAGVDCVAITDHNSGAWIDRLADAYAGMEKRASLGAAPPGFRALALFPGVELTVTGGVHVLALLPVGKRTSDIDTLLGSVGYRGTKGDTLGTTQVGLGEVLRLVSEAGGLPIPAHADRDKGMFQCHPGTRSAVFDANTIREALSAESLLAVEWCDPKNPMPKLVPESVVLARVLGSDTHNFERPPVPGSHYTWVKMQSPSLEGLRLALLDGNGSSLRRSDDPVPFDPQALPDHTIEAITITKARYMGNARPVDLRFSPFFNAVVGGRGTGKSSVVHALRLAAGRGLELPDGEPKKRFESFRKVAKGRTGDGALREATEITVTWRLPGGARERCVWKTLGTDAVVERLGAGGQWAPTPSQTVNPERFPVQIFSQGQIARLASEGRPYLLGIIDDAASIRPLQVEHEDARRMFFEQRARLRTLEGQLRELPEVERKLAETERRLEGFARSNHAAVLREYARTHRQQTEIKGTLDQADGLAVTLDQQVAELVLDDWDTQNRGPSDDDLDGWRQAVDAAVSGLRAKVDEAVRAFRAELDTLKKSDLRLDAWKVRRKAAVEAHQGLREAGAVEPGLFERLTQEHQGLTQRRKDLVRLRADSEALRTTITTQQTLIAERREAITLRRRAFVEDVLRDNPHVRIEVVPYGFDAEQLESALRELLEAEDEKFAGDILAEGKGLAADLAGATDKQAGLRRLRERVLQPDPALHGQFRHHLTRKRSRPEFDDHVLVWTPEDDLRIEYGRDGEWVSIAQGSQGQRSAALLAFLLSFGNEPLVLDQPEDDLDNELIYTLIVKQIGVNKARRQLIVVTHNPNIVVNGDAELVHVMGFKRGECLLLTEGQSGALQEPKVRDEVCRVMEGGREAFTRRWKRLGGAG